MSDRQRLVVALRWDVPADLGVPVNLAAALAQLTGQTGKLVRARLVLRLARSLGWNDESAIQLACALEYFHLASLALDDLPCMDNALERRGQPCIHRRYGEATAILAALALLNRAYHLVHLAFVTRPASQQVAASRWLDRLLGPAGLVGGQARDLAYDPAAEPVREIGRIAVAKTGSLFALAVMLPALADEAGSEDIRGLRALGLYWGLAFQVADDLRDVISSRAVEGKCTGRDRALHRPNLALAIGTDAAFARLERLTAQANRVLAQLTAAQHVCAPELATFHMEVAALPAYLAHTAA